MLQSESFMMQCKRFGSKINTRKPRPPHYTRKLFNAVTEPVYARKTAIDLCHEKQALIELEKEYGEKNQLHPYEIILANELREFFESAQMILICQKNSMDSYEFFNFKVAMHRQNVKVKVFGRKIIKGAIVDTKFRPMLKLLTDTPHNCMLFSDKWNINDVLKVLKKIPKVILLAGTLGNRFMSRNELENYAKLPDLPMAQAQFVATMNSVGGQLTNHLQAHQSNFAYMLDAHVEALKNSNTTTIITDSSTTPKTENAVETTKKSA